MYHHLRGTTGELLGVLACDLLVRARVTGPTQSAAKVFTFGTSATVEALEAGAGRSTFVDVEEAAAPVSRTDDSCVALTTGCESEGLAPDCNVFLIFSLTGGWRVENSDVRVATGGSQGAVGGIVTGCHERRVCAPSTRLLKLLTDHARPQLACQ